MQVDNRTYSLLKSTRPTETRQPDRRSAHGREWTIPTRRAPSELGLRLGYAIGEEDQTGQAGFQTWIFKPRPGRRGVRYHVDGWIR